MSESANKTTIDGVDIVQDGDVTHFTVSDDVKRLDELKRERELAEKAEQPSSLLKRICRWFKRNDIHPYVKVADLSDPVGNRSPDDIDKGSDGHSAVEVGVKIGF